MNTAGVVDEATRAELLKRIKDPADLPKFERFFRLYGKRLERLGPNAGPSAMVAATMTCWRRAFGAEWPRTQAEASGGVGSPELPPHVVNGPRTGSRKSRVLPGGPSGAGNAPPHSPTG